MNRNGKRNLRRMAAGFGILLLLSLTAVAQAQSLAAPEEAKPQPSIAAPEKTAADYQMEKAKMEAEKARLDAEKARLETEKIRLELERLKTDKSAAAKKDDDKAEKANEPDKEAVEGRHRHDGLFLRMSTGPGFGVFMGKGTKNHGPVAIYDDPEGYVSTWGFVFSIGGNVAENLILHAEFAGMGGFAGQSEHHEFGGHHLGLGVTYYFMPANIYITGSVGPSFVTMTRNDTFDHCDDDMDLDAAIGIGASFGVGREWWISDNWALGVGAKLLYSYTAEDDDLDMHHVGGLILFTATYD